MVDNKLLSLKYINQTGVRINEYRKQNDFNVKEANIGNTFIYTCNFIAL